MLGVYRRLCATPGTVAVIVAGFGAQMAHLMTVLGIIFFVSAATGSYGLAGALSATYAMTYAVASPFVSRMAERFGQHRVLAVTAVANTVSRAGFLVAVWLEMPTLILVLSAGLSGATMPATGALVRARFSYLFRGSSLLNSALAGASVVDDVIMVVGPVLVATISTAWEPAAGLFFALVLGAVSQAALAAQRRTQPPIHPAGRRHGTALSTTGFVMLLLTFTALGAAEGTLHLSTVAFSSEQHAKALSGPILATLALSSALSGLWYGSRARARPERHLVTALLLCTVGMLLFAAASTIWFAFVAATAAGIALAPAFISGFSVVHHSVARRALTEGMTLLTTAVGIGISLGSTLAGILTDQWSPWIAYLSAAIWTTVAVATALLTALRLPDTTPVLGQN